MGGDLDLLQKAYREPERDRGRARLKVGQPNALSPAPVEIARRVLAFPIGSLFGPAGGRNLSGLFRGPPFRAAWARSIPGPPFGGKRPPRGPAASALSSGFRNVLNQESDPEWRAS